MLLNREKRRKSGYKQYKNNSNCNSFMGQYFSSRQSRRGNVVVEDMRTVVVIVVIVSLFASVVDDE